MIYRLALLLTVIAGMHLSQAQSPTGIQWEKNFGGNDTDAASVVKPTSDGGFILGGYSYSEISGVKTTPGFGLGDYWILKLDANGSKQWDQTFGGDRFDGIKALQQSSDSGYILGGISFSDASGNKTSGNYGAGDFWIIKLNASGGKLWDKSFGGTNLDRLATVQQTSDGGYILGGTSFSGASGNKSSESFGGDSGDYWIVKLDGNGNKQWDRTFGGKELDELNDLRQTSDGGYILAGHSSSGVSGNKASGNFGDGTSDYWIVKVDASGNKQWEKTYGGDDTDELYAVQLTSDSGFVLGGYSYSGISGNKSSGNFGSHDFWLVKLDANGNKQWDKSYGGESEDKLYSVQQRSDGGYILGGISFSDISGNKTGTSGTADSGDYWIVNVDANGNKQSEQSLRCNYPTEISPLQEMPDGACVLAGSANATGSTDVNYAMTKLSALLRLNLSLVGPEKMLRLVGSPAVRYILQSSTDLISWKAIATNSAPDGLVSFVDAGGSNFSKRFYRVQQQP